MVAIEDLNVHVDRRLAEAGFAGGVTTRAMGDMAQADNRARALERAGLASWPGCVLRQKHGSVVRALDAETEQSPEGDGWLLDAAGRVALVYVADCMPIFIWDRGGRAAALLHSGWRGTRANIAAAAVEALALRGVKPAELRAWVGPHAGACCYAVGSDFKALFRPESLEPRGGRLYLDLGKEAAAQLLEAGLSREAIAKSPACTVCGSEFFSFRRDKATRRMMAFLAKRHA
ncbi:MAG: polyphenol oxidase family protein [Elusimicrobia bacterium]|nr:polyphenol oxidase family protein [Elusimicrobiota bacterium]